MLAHPVRDRIDMALPAAFHPIRHGLLWLALGASATGIAHARKTPAEPHVSQVPGYYHQSIGTLRVTALFDGLVALPSGKLHGASEANKEAAFSRNFVPRTSDGVQTAVNAYLVKTQGQLILVDAGASQCFGTGLGHVPGNLRAAGYDARDIDVVLLTHAHPDHICGLTDTTGKPTYPNATVWLSQRDAEFWLDPAHENPGTPDMLKSLSKMARNATKPYQAKGALRLFGDDARMPDGVEALASHGHSPGHTSFLFGTDATQPLLIWGDIVHYHAVQFTNPAASVEFDHDRAQAISTRRELLARIADGQWWLAGAHMPFPGLGHVRRDGEIYAWVPVEFSPLPP